MRKFNRNWDKPIRNYRSKCQKSEKIPFLTDEEVKHRQLEREAEEMLRW